MMSGKLIVSDGKKYDGRYKLYGDEIAMRLKGVKTIEDKSAFFNVSEDDINDGIVWAGNNLKKLKEERRRDTRGYFGKHLQLNLTHIPSIDIISSETGKYKIIGGKPVEEWDHLF